MKQKETDVTALLLQKTLIGIDTGGTFTDFVFYHQGRLIVHKVLSTPEAPEEAILQGISELGVSLQGLHVIHGSTVATNAVLEARGVSTVFITNRGFADMLSIGRQARTQLYNLQPALVTVPVAADYCLETGGRLSSSGKIIEALTEEDLARLKQQIADLNPRAVAINLLFSWLSPALEQRIAAALPQDLFISCSSEVLPEYREYERGIATWLNAWTGPLVQGYLQRLEDRLAPASVSVIQSSGSAVSASYAGQHAVNMLLSGPAGGLTAAQYIGQKAGFQQIMTFDMGGTSTDVALIDERIRVTTEGHIAGYPVAVPMVDMHTIGAGGGSLAYVDAGGLLHVGPESAGASPGPACYDMGGNQATVTDAHLVLGKLLPDMFLGGAMKLDAEAAVQSVLKVAAQLSSTCEEAAEGIIRLANEHMARALRVISLQQGYDPRDFVLMSFGGAGGLHVCALADIMQMNQAIIPVHGGVLSALGMLVTAPGRQLSRTVNINSDQLDAVLLEGVVTELIAKGLTDLRNEGIREDSVSVETSLDLRYYGQTWALNVVHQASDVTYEQCIADFHQIHLKTYGHSLRQSVEIVNIRVSVSGPTAKVGLEHCQTPEKHYHGISTRIAGIAEPVSVFERKSLSAGKIIKGPALITEPVATSYIAPEWDCVVDIVGNLILRRH